MSADGRRRPSVLGNLAHGAAGNLLMPVSSVLTGPLIARSLDPAGRGAMAAIVVPISLVNLLFTAGLPEAATYFSARRRIGRDRFLRRLIIGSLLVGTVAAAGTIGMSHVILRKYHGLLRPYDLLSLTLIPSIAFAALRGLLVGHRRFDLVFRERLAATLLRTAGLVALVSVGVLTASNAAATTIIAAIVGSLVLLAGWHVIPKQSREPPGAVELAKYTSAAAIATLGSVLVLRVDQTIMAPLTSASQLGFYAVAVSLAELPLALTSAVQDVVFAVSADKNDSHYAARACRQTNLIMLLICGSACLLAPFALPLLFGSAFRPSIWPTIILLIGTLVSSTTSVLGSGLMVAGRPLLRSVAMAGAACLTIPLLFVLVPRFGADGAAAVSAGTYAALAVTVTVLYSRVSGIRAFDCIIPSRDEFRALRTFARNAALRVAAGRNRRTRAADDESLGL